jgi:hypothetical protein
MQMTYLCVCWLGIVVSLKYEIVKSTLINIIIIQANNIADMLVGAGKKTLLYSLTLEEDIPYKVKNGLW